MGLILDSNFRNSVDLRQAYDPRIGAVCLPRASEATVSVSAETVGGEKENAYKEGLTFDFWRPGTSGDHWLRASFSAGYDGKSFDFSSILTDAKGITFSGDGLSLFILSGADDKIYQFSLRRSFNINTIASTGITLDVSTEDNDPQDLVISPDGTRVYLVGIQNTKVYQYNLSTPDDLSTASYAGASFDLVTVEPLPTGLTLKPDGTKLFIIGAIRRPIGYTLSTPFDLSTAGSETLGASMAGQDLTTRQIAFSSTGQTMYMAGDTNNKIFKYSLSTPWDETTVAYLGVPTNQDISSEETSPTGMVLVSDSKLFVVGTIGNKIFQYTVGVTTDYLGVAAHDLHNNGGTVKSQYGRKDAFNPTLPSGLPASLIFGNSGLKLFVLATSNKIFSYSLAIAFDISTASYDGGSFDLDVSAQDGAVLGLTLGNAGTKLFISGAVNKKVFSYTLSTPFDTSTATYDGAPSDLDVSGEMVSPQGLTLSVSGSRLLVLGAANKKVYSYTLSTPLDLSTATYDGAPSDLDVSGEATNPSEIVLRNAGGDLYVTDSSNDTFHQYTLSTPDDLSTASYSGNSLNVTSLDNTANSMDISDDGLNLIFTGSGLPGRLIYSYTLSTAWDISTGEYITWVDSSDTHTPTDSSPIMMLHDEVVSLDHRVVINVTSTPSIGVINFGTTLKYTTPISSAHNPPHLNRDNRYVNEVSEGGANLGKSLISEGVDLTLDVRGHDTEWLRDQWESTVRLIEQYPFFFCARDVPKIKEDEEEVFYGWTIDQPRGGYSNSVMGKNSIRARGIVT